MEFPALKEAKGKLNAKRDALAKVFSEAGPDIDLDKVKCIPGDRTEKLGLIQLANAEIAELGKEVQDLLDVAKAAEDAKAHAERREAGTDDVEPTKAAKSFGKLLVASEAVKAWKGGQGPTSQIDVGLKTLFETTAGWDPFDARSDRVELLATRPAPHVVNFIPQTTTGQSTVKYMEETTFTNAAAEAAEGTAYGEATLVLTEKSSEVRKVAVFLPVTDEQFEDEPRAESYVNNRLPFMLRQRLDSQALVGNGTAPNLRGTENVVGIQSQALGTDSIPDATYKAMRLIRDDGFAEPSVVFIRPSKWETVRLLKTADGQYVWGHPALPGPETIWGVPVVQTTAPTATKAVIGDYRNFSELAARRGIEVQVSNSHGSFFIEGKLAIRADVRVALVHYRPKAFAVVTGL